MTESHAKRTVLVVDDSPTNRLKLKTATTNIGHNVVEAADGEAALERLRADGIDLVLLDIMMPGIDGYEVLRRMHADEDLREIPVLVISSLEDMGDAIRAIELGAEDFLTKSFDPVLLRARMASCLERKRMRDRELDYLREVRQLTAAARTLEGTGFDPASLGLDGIAARGDMLGNLARVFVRMAIEVHRRESAYRNRISLLRGSFLLLLIGFLWGLSPSIARLLKEGPADGVGLTAWVTLISAAIMLVVSLARGRIPKLTLGRMRFGILLGLMGTALPQIAMFIAAEQVPATVISVILALEALFVFAIAALLRIEAPSYRRFSGLLLGLICVLVIVLPEDGASGLGSPLFVLIALFVPLGYAGEVVTLSIWPFEEDDPLDLTFLTSAGATVATWPMALVLGDLPEPRALFEGTGLLVPLLSVISCLASILLVLAVRRTGAVFTSQTAYVITGAGVVWSVLLLGETVSVWIWLALAMIAAGLVLVQPTPGSLFGKDEDGADAAGTPAH